MEALTQAMEVLCITHSPHSMLVRDLSSLLHEAHAEAAHQEQQEG